MSGGIRNYFHFARASKVALNSPNDETVLSKIDRFNLFLFFSLPKRVLRMKTLLFFGSKTSAERINHQPLPPRHSPNSYKLQTVTNCQNERDHQRGIRKAIMKLRLIVNRTGDSQSQTERLVSPE